GPQKNNWAILLGLKVRSSVGACGHLPLVNSFVGTLTGAPIPAHLRPVIFRRALTVYLDDTRDFPRLYREPKFGDDDFSVVARTLQVTGSLLRDIRMNGDGRVPESVFGRELSQRLVLLARQISVRNEPGWLRAGFGSLCRDIRVSPRQIEFGEFRQYLNMNFDPPRLVDVLNGKRPFPSIRNGREVAKVFVHYCLFASNGAQSARFRNFINRLDEEPFSEALFEECFGKKVSAFESDVISHWHLMTPKKRVIYKWDTPPLPGIVAREATQSEVARLKAEMLIARGQSPKALDELRTAYWRGGRDPWMLALLALLEEHIGSIPRAEKITKTLLALPQAPARAQVVAAKLRMRELGAWEDDGKKLDKAGADSIMDLLVKARLGGLLNEDLCATLSRLVIKSAESPSTDTAAFIKEAAKRYPLNKIIREASGMHGAATAGGLPARRRPPRNQSRSP
ncbi:MAG: hypothetical protein LBM04_02465, partial [Opitutaceae bacterium]|nr:hypothetical protein [Opitutaceae bacterium]